MKSLLSPAGALTAFVLFFCSQVYAQGNAANPAETEESSKDERPVPNSQEVEVNEDVYRQFMELRNSRQQRNILPEEAFKPSSGSQKLDKLPEESQKHLRNQLREIIVRGAPWQPGDENKNYPYVPSVAATENQQLQTQEAEAWGELLDSYHKREAQIHENSARTAAAMASENSMDSGSAGTGGGQNSSKQGTGQAGNGESAESMKRAEAQRGESADLAKTSQVTSSTGTAGVSQNAMEFLKRMGSSGGQVDSDNRAQSGNNEDTGAMSGVGEPQREPTPMVQENSAELNADMDQVSEASSESLAGTSQNALDFLKQNDGQDGDNTAESEGSSPGENDNNGESGEELADASNEHSESTDTNTNHPVSRQDTTSDTAGTSQNALEYLSGEQPPSPAVQDPGATVPANLSGTLSIEDLVNARGVGTERNLTPPVDSGGGQNPATKPPEEKDDDS